MKKGILKQNQNEKRITKAKPKDVLIAGASHCSIKMRVKQRVSIFAEWYC